MNFEWPSPKTLLRISVILCLVGWGISLIVTVRNPGSFAAGVIWARELAVLFFLSACAFGLFYIEYRVVQGMTNRELNLRLGYVQSLGCLTFLLLAVRGIRAAMLAGTAQASPGLFQRNPLATILIFGQFVFLVNVVWSYMQEDYVLPKKRPPGDKRAPTWGWPESPSKLFGIAGAFFGVMGVVLSMLGVLTSRVPIPINGRVSLIPAGLLLIPAALPFAIFALLYWKFESKRGWVSDQSAIRIHFMCTLFAVVASIFIYTSWVSVSLGRVNASFPWGNFMGAFAFLGLSVGVFVWNVRKSGRHPLPQERTGKSVRRA